MKTNFAMNNSSFQKAVMLLLMSVILAVTFFHLTRRTLYSHIYQQSDLIDKADERRFSDAPAWKAALDEHNIQYTITPVSFPLVRALSLDREWIPIFSSNNSVIFVRNTVDNRAVIEKYAIDKGYN